MNRIGGLLRLNLITPPTPSGRVVVVGEDEPFSIPSNLFRCILNVSFLPFLPRHYENKFSVAISSPLVLMFLLLFLLCSPI
jgi:hypothetical protein